jgi:hypothetical protein
MTLLRKLMLIATMATGMFASGGAAATTIDFDDLAQNGSFNPVPYSYAGLLFSTSDYVNNPAVAHSGDNAMVLWNESIQFIRSAPGTTFTLNSLWMRTYGAGETEDVYVLGFLNGNGGTGQPDYWTKLSVTDQYSNYTVDFANVETIWLSTIYRIVAVDDIRINELLGPDAPSPLPQPVSSVPEAQTCLMLLAGLGLIGAACSWRQRDARMRAMSVAGGGEAG